MAKDQKTRQPAKTGSRGQGGASSNAAAAPARKKSANPLKFFSEVRQEGRKVTWTDEYELRVVNLKTDPLELEPEVLDEVGIEGRVELAVGGKLVDLELERVHPPVDQVGVDTLEPDVDRVGSDRIRRGRRYGARHRVRSGALQRHRLHEAPRVVRVRP